MEGIKKIWCVRHGAYVTFDEGGHPNDPILSSIGIEQAKRLGNIFGKREIEEIRISPLNRARQTYENSGCRGRNVLFDTRLLEIANIERYKTLLPYRTPGYAYADRWNAWMEDGGERARALLEDLKASPAEEILLISHWAFLSTFMITALGFQAKEHHPPHAYARMNHACYSLLEMEAGHPVRIVHWNIGDHLKGLPVPKEQGKAPPIHPS